MKITNIEIMLKDGVKDISAEKLSRSAEKYFGIDTGKVKSGKIYSVIYDLDRDKIDRFARNCLRDSIINDIYIDKLYDDPTYNKYILIAKKPGVTDDEGISAQNSLADFLNLDIDTKTQHVYTQNIYLIENKLTDDKLKTLSEKILGNKLINHFEYGVFDGVIKYVPEVKISTDKTIDTIDIFTNDENLLKLSKNMLLSLNIDEMKAIRRYFENDDIRRIRLSKGLTEYPTDCEIEIIAQTWSEHCKHKEFNAIIDYKDKASGKSKRINSLFKTYIKASTDIIQKRLIDNDIHWLVKVFSDNAGVVRINDDYVFVWKVETHNSPSAIDPYGGAITGILGNNRDPLGTGIGGGRLLFNTNVLCFGSPFYDKKLLAGQLHPKRVFDGVRHGIEDGGNKSGIPTVNGSIVFDDRYSGKPLVYCGTGSVMPAKYQNRDSRVKEIDAGDRIIMAGGRVGKDGIHGATFSSAEIDEHSPQSAVQIGSPITQKLLSDFLEIATKRGLIKCSTDNGAGGLSSSVGELAEISNGAVINLEKVPLKYHGIKLWEIFLSESQERMTLVVENKDVKELFTLADKMEVELSDIGFFTSDAYLDVRYEDMPVAYLELDFLHNGVPQKHLEAEWVTPDLQKARIPMDKDYNEVLLKLMGSLNICSRENVIRQYDHEVKGKTIIKPLMGDKGKAPQDSAVVRINFDSYEAVAISNGIIPRYGDIDAYEMSAGSFDEAVRQIVSVGGQLPNLDRKGNHFWTVNDNFCVPDSVYDSANNPDGRLKLGKLVNMCEALFDMSTFFNIPMTSGKDSMKNDFKSQGEKISVPPTILYSMVAKIEDFRDTITSEYKSEGDFIYILGKTYDELGSSEFYRLFDQIGDNVPKVRKEDAKRIYEKHNKASRLGLIESSHDTSDGGMVVSLVESSFSSDFGVDIDIMSSEGLNHDAILFSESHSRFIVSIKPENRRDFETIFGSDAQYIGRVTNNNNISVRIGGELLIDIDKDRLMSAWSGGLEN